MKPILIFISHLGLQHIQKQKNSKRVGNKILKFCLYYNRMTQTGSGGPHLGIFDFAHFAQFGHFAQLMGNFLKFFEKNCYFNAIGSSVPHKRKKVRKLRNFFRHFRTESLRILAFFSRQKPAFLFPAKNRK